MTTLNVTVQSVRFPPSTNTEQETWYILSTNQGTAKGRMAWRPQPQESLMLEGNWATYKGEKEFSFTTARLDIPTNPRDQLHYVCIRTAGLGPTAENLIWSKYGNNWQNAEPSSVPRLNGKVYENFKLQIEALSGKSEEAKVVATLIGKGATVKMACAAWEQWKGETLGIVNSDPFRLAELAGYGFKDVDREIRIAYGIADDDRRRIKAAVVYALRRLTDDGDTIVAWEDLYQRSTGMLGGYSDLISDCAKELFEDGTLRAFPNSQGVSLASDFRDECDIWEFINNSSATAQEGE
jgi:hypothetical protein